MAKVDKDPWKHRSNGMVCNTCMWWVPKERVDGHEPIEGSKTLGRCRKRAPMADKGFAPTFEDDWCGDHRLDENRV